MKFKAGKQQPQGTLSLCFSWTAAACRRFGLGSLLPNPEFGP
jgi:hypothetical protein